MKNALKIIQRLIAREGLIILSCLVFAGFVFLIAEMIPYGEPRYIYRCATGGQQYDISTNGVVIISNAKNELALFKAVKRKYPEAFKGTRFISSAPTDFKFKYLRKGHTLRDRIKDYIQNLALIFLFLSYPFYLLIRFIIWAIRTVREK
ncbi:MAG: hypothetical protein HQ579_08945 [Candidatus Omnitrophica bacterium]|nr:hypothetical protein [Candidatus Omnitrophota bacterium]